MHAATLIWIRPSAYHLYSPLQLICRHEPNISYLRVFGCVVYVPIAPPQHAKMSSQRRLGIYVGYKSPTILKYLYLDKYKAIYLSHVLLIVNLTRHISRH